MKRREFISTSVMAAAGAYWLSSCANERTQMPIGLQLYTLRDMFAKDVRGTLELLAQIGYKEFEAWGYSEGNIVGMRYTDFAKQVRQAGLKLVSTHFDTGYEKPERKGTLVNGWETVIEDAKNAGQPYMVIGWLDAGERNSIDAIKRTCERINKGGEACKRSDIRLAFHNHANEFVRIDGQLLYDVMLAELDPAYVTMELDLYWMVLGNCDPLEYINKYPGRFELFHVKDMDKTDKMKTSDLGTGAIDLKKIFENADKAGLKHAIIEQENFPGLPETSVRNSFNYLNDLLN